MSDNLKYAHALQFVLRASYPVFEKIQRAYDGNLKKAWLGGLSRYLDENQLALFKKTDPDALWKKLAKLNIEIIARDDPRYPDRLLQISQPPFVIYLRGSADAWTKPCLAVVGTRRMTDYGRRSASHIVRDLQGSELCIVSGMAFGIDTVALSESIKSGLKTVAVLGGGIDDRTIYPPSNLKLAHDIVESGGAVISEYPPGMHSTKFTFPHRNRIVSGMSLGVVVVEADLKSGSMITARCAADQDRDVFAIPGQIFATTSQGNHYLIQKGAKLITCGADILEEYQLSGVAQIKSPKAANTEEGLLLELLSTSPKSIDDIIRESGLASARVIAALSIMEVTGKIKQAGGRRYIVGK